MDIFTNTISAREVQRNLNKALRLADVSSTPVIVISKNKPVGAIVSLKNLKFQIANSN